jgi:hypothetical protein
VRKTQQELCNEIGISVTTLKDIWVEEK